MKAFVKDRILSVLLSSPSSPCVGLQRMPLKHRRRARLVWSSIGKAIAAGALLVTGYYIAFVYTPRMPLADLPVGHTSDPYWADQQCRADATCRANARTAYLRGQLDRNPPVKVPRVIHQYLDDADAVPAELYSRGERFPVASWMKTWVDHNPTWRYMFWSRLDAYAFVKSAFPDRSDRFQRLPAPTQRQFLWYAILFLVGGVVVDPDVECVAPIPDAFVDQYDAFVGLEHELHANVLLHKPNTISLSVMGSRPGHALWPMLMDGMLDSSGEPEQDIDEMMRDASVLTRLQTLGSAIEILPSSVFHPNVAAWALPDLLAACRDETRPDVAISSDACADLLRSAAGNHQRHPNAIAIQHHVRSWGRSLRSRYASIADVIPVSRLERPFDDDRQWRWASQ
ncbi:Uncharacterized protein PBTT_09634 [Plasmodiophora brassicae]